MTTIRTTTLGFALILGLAAPAALAQSVNLTGETSAPGNSPHVNATHVARILSREGIADMQLTEGQVATNSVLNVARGRTDYATAPTFLSFLLSRGAGPYAQIGAEEGAQLAANLRVLWPYNAGGYGLLAFESSGITSWHDLAGKTVYNGPPQGAAVTNARQVVQAITGMEDGTGYTGMQADWGMLATLLVDGSADAFVVPLTMPSDRITVMASAGRVNVVSVPRDVFEGEGFQRLLRAPGNVPIVIPRDRMGHGDEINLISDDGVMRMMGTAFADLVHKDMDFDLARRMTAAYIATLDELRAATPYAATVNFGITDQVTTGFCGAIPLRYHPGAIAAWEEAGYTIPDCARPEG
jgi:uncharacterized protein